MNTTLFARLQLQAAFRRVIEQYGESVALSIIADAVERELAHTDLALAIAK